MLNIVLMYTGEQGGLDAHNKFRQLHGATPMKLNSEMSAEAKSYAAIIAKRGQLQHSDSKDGENLAYSCKQKAEGSPMKEATKNWYVMWKIYCTKQILYLILLNSLEGGGGGGGVGRRGGWGALSCVILYF